MATPGGKKPNKQQINDAGNEVGLDLANAIGKAISRTLSNYDFSPLAKNIVKSIGKVDISSLLKTDDAKIKQLASNAKTTLEKGIGTIKVGTELDSDKFSAAQKALQQLSDLQVRAAITSVDTTTLDKEFAQIKPADIQAIVSSVDSSLIDSEVNKLKPINLLAKVSSIDSGLIDVETGKLKPIDLQAIVGSVDTDAINTEISKVNPIDLQAKVGSVDISLISKESGTIKPIDLLAKVATVDSTLIGNEASKLKPIDLQAIVNSVDSSIIDTETGKLKSIELTAGIANLDTSLIDSMIGKLKSSELQATISSVNTDLIATEVAKVNPLDLQAKVASVDVSTIAAEYSKLEPAELTANIASVGVAMIADEISKVNPLQLQAGIGSVDTSSVEKEFAKIKPPTLSTEIGSVNVDLIEKELQKYNPIELKALVSSVDTSLVDTEFGKLKLADLQALITEVDTSLVGEEVSKLNPIALQAKLAELDSSIVDSMPQVSIKGTLAVDQANIQDQLNNLPSAELQGTIGQIEQPREDLFGPIEVNPKVGKLDFDADRLISVIEKSFMRLNTTLSVMGATLRKEISSDAFQPAIRSTQTLAREFTTAASSMGELPDSVSDLKQEIKESAKLVSMLSVDAELYSRWNGESLQITKAIAETYNVLTKSSKQELATAAQKLNIANAENLSKQELVGLVGNNLVKLKEEEKLNDNILSSYGDMEEALKQVQADIKLKNVMIKTGLTGEFAETARLLEKKKESGELTDEAYHQQIKVLELRHHEYEQLVKNRDIIESLANWQLELKEELEGYEKGWEKVKSKVKAIITDPKLAKTVFAAEGIKTAIEGVKKFGEGFEKLKEQGLSAGQAATAQVKTLSAMSVLGLSDTQGVMEQVIESYGNANALSRGQVDSIGQMAHHMGITGQEAMKVNEILSQMGGETTESAIEAMHFTENLAKANGVAPGKVMKDIAKNSAAVALYSKDGAKGFGKAAIELQKMGVEIGTAAKMADGLLDFENSINKQMEASVLLGRSINLDKARELALNGDLEGSTREVLANIGGAGELDKMNVLQKKALAEAAGLTVEELVKAVDAQEEQQKYHGEESGFWMNTIGYVTEYGSKLGGFLKEHGMLMLSGLNVLGQQETRQLLINGLTKGYNALKTIGNGILLAGKAIFDSEAREKVILWAKEKAHWVLQKAHLAYLKTAAFFGSDKAKEKLAGMAKEKITGAVTDKAKDLATDKAKDLATDKVKGIAEDKAGDLAGKAAEGTDKLGESGGKVGKKGMTEGFKDGMKNIADGFKEMGSGKVLAGIFNTMIAGPALVVALPAIPFLLFMGKVALNQLSPNFTNLAAGLTAMSATFAGSAALAVFGIAAIPSVLSIPFLLFMGLTPLAQLATNLGSLATGLTMMAGSFAGSAALAAFGIAAVIAIPSLVFLAGVALLGAAGAAGLTALGTGLAALGGVAATGLPFIAVGLIAALGVAMIPFAAALTIATPAIKAFGDTIIGVFQQIPPIIAAVAAGFVTVFSTFAQNWQILIPVGIGLAAVAMGLTTLGAAAAFAFPGLVLASVGLMTMVPGLTLINQLATNGGLIVLSQTLATLGTAGPSLGMVGASLFGIAGGLGAMTIAGLAAMPIIGALIGLAAVAPALASIGLGGGGAGGGNEATQTETKAGGESNKEDSMMILIEEIRGLRSELSKGGTINMDGKKVGDVLRLAMNTSGVR